MSTAGRTITIYLAADADRFKRGMGEADRSARDLRTRLGKLGGTFKAAIGPALLGAGAAAGGLAIKLGVDGVKAAIENEAAVKRLSTTMENLGLAQDVGPIEDYIEQMQIQYGIADSKLRPAFERLVRSTEDTSDAQDLLSLAMDVSTGTGKDLETVATALAKAHDGQTTALGKLGTGLDTTTIKTGDMNVITGKLADTFGGQAAAKAETWQGKLDRVTEAFGELQESFGQGFLDALSTAQTEGDQIGDTFERLKPLAEGLGTGLGSMVTSAGDFVSIAGDLGETIDSQIGDWGVFSRLIEAVWTTVSRPNPFRDVVTSLQILDDILSNGNFDTPFWQLPNTIYKRITGRDLPSGPVVINPVPGAVNPGSSDYLRPRDRPAVNPGSSDWMRPRSTNITVVTGVGDPVEISRGVRRALELDRRRVG